MEAIIEGEPALLERRSILESIPGIGRQTASVMLIDMPEPGEFDARQAASLAGSSTGCLAHLGASSSTKTHVGRIAVDLNQ
jgi:hypothetical protein